MKIRSLHPQFFSDRELAAMSLRARLLYQGLWVYADDHGRGEWLPKHIEGAIFPFEEMDFQAVWDELEAADKVVIYEADGRPYFYLPNFSKWQKPKYVRDSKIPAPPNSGPTPPDAEPSDTKAWEASTQVGTESGTNQGQAGTRVPRQAVAAAVEGEVEAAGGGGVEGECLPKPKSIPESEWGFVCGLVEARKAEGYPVADDLRFARHLWNTEKDRIRQAAARGTPTAPEIEKLLVSIGQTIPEDR